jgi:hypothetical protein
VCQSHTGRLTGLWFLLNRPKGWILMNEWMNIYPVTWHWSYLNVQWLFHLVCIIYCGCFNMLCNVWMLWQLCGYSGNFFSFIFCVLYFCTVFLLFGLCIFILICFVFTSVRTTATKWKLNFSNNNNNNNNTTLRVIEKGNDRTWLRAAFLDLWETAARYFYFFS